MKKHVRKIIIDTQEKLIDFFNDKSLRMKKNSTLSFYNDLKLESNIVFEGKTKLGKNNSIGPNCFINNVKIGNDNIIKMSSLIENSSIHNQNTIGPFAFIRGNSFIGSDCIIGAYAEVTRSFIKNRCLASHRVFIGDATIGEGAIIGAGTVFCNYNFNTNLKSKSKIGKNCKIGSNSTLIAPINVKSNSIIPASTKYKG